MRIIIDVNEKSGAASVVSTTGPDRSNVDAHSAVTVQPSVRQPSGVLSSVAVAVWAVVGLLMALWLSAGVVSGALFRHWYNSQVLMLTILSLGGMTTAVYLIGRRKLLRREPLRPWQSLTLMVVCLATSLLFLVAGAG